MSVIYNPKGAAGEYAELALNIYSGCTNECYYCYVPKVLHKTPADFHKDVKPRADIVWKVQKDMDTGEYAGRMVHLCFTCDPYPTGTDTMPTREIIQIIKAGGGHVQLLTKNPLMAMRDFDLLDGEDSFGVTLTAFTADISLLAEPHAGLPSGRLLTLAAAKGKGLKTWVSFEPVIRADDTLALLKAVIEDKSSDIVKLGKMNYNEPLEHVNWAAFGREVEAICKKAGQAYIIKNDLRTEMEKAK